MLRKTLVAIILGLAAGASLAQDDVGKVLFIAEDDNGKVWANLSLSGQRMDEPYLPMVVAVENKLKKPATVDRESFWLEDLEGIVYVMPTVKEQRKNYKKTVMDYRTVSYAGIPWESWRYNRRLETTNFFPNLQSTRANVVRDKATLRQRHAMVDLMYFERPRNLQIGKPFFLVVHPEGWETPIRLRLIIT